MRFRGKLERSPSDDSDELGLRIQVPGYPEPELITLSELAEDYENQEVNFSIIGAGAESSRGQVICQPIIFGMTHYRDKLGSVCAADKVGTPEFTGPTREETMIRGNGLETICRAYAPVEELAVNPVICVATWDEMREIDLQMPAGTDFMVIDTFGIISWEVKRLKRFNIPIYHAMPPREVFAAHAVKKYLQQSKILYIGEIPSFSAPDGPWNWYSEDGTSVEEKMGVYIRHVETNEIFRWYDKQPEELVADTLKAWEKADFKNIVEDDWKNGPVGDAHQNLLDTTRLYLALKGLAKQEDANAITVNCGRFTEERPVVPCLPFNRLIDEGIMCACEGDITAMLSSMILHAASGRKPVTMGNFGKSKGHFEAREGEVSIEHDVVPRSMCTDGWQLRNYHLRHFGVTAYGPLRKEPVTLFNLASTLDECSVFTGKLVDSYDGGHCRCIFNIELDGDVEKVPEVAVGSQHISLVYGNWLKTLKAVGKMLNINVRTLI